ncbi:MAG: hypothetical protein JW994_04215 [Candidatus Omnitrophica bacterium]|nr:hypothetical protein [Candidatus Omnitrophota bacterium]
MNKRSFFILTMFLSATLSGGCNSVTYPKEKLEECVVELCKDEYNINIETSVVGSTLAIYIELPSLFDINLSLSEEAQDIVQDVLLAASRVCLSTDADIKFYCIIAQDARIPEIQLIIIKYTDDVKRAFYQDISRGEYFKRTLIDINENPQAKKENAITDVFGKMNLSKEMQDTVLNDFFRSPPTSLEGIGYWNDRFYIKDITIEEFLAQQIASRVKVKFREINDLRKYTVKMVEGKYVTEDKTRTFLITFTAEGLLFVLDPAKKLSGERKVFENIFEEASDVIYGYKFTNFDFLKLADKTLRKEIAVTKDDIYAFKRRRLGIDSIFAAFN